MKTTQPASRSQKKTRSLPLHSFLNPHVYSLMTIPFPVFVTDKQDKIIPTITVPEFHQLVKTGSRFQE